MVPPMAEAAAQFGQTVELGMAIEEEFAIEIPDAEADQIRSKIRSCGDAIPTAYLSARPLSGPLPKAPKDGDRPDARRSKQNQPG